MTWSASTDRPRFARRRRQGITFVIVGAGTLMLVMTLTMAYLMSSRGTFTETVSRTETVIARTLARSGTERARTFLEAYCQGNPEADQVLGTSLSTWMALKQREGELPGGRWVIEAVEPIRMERDGDLPAWCVRIGAVREHGRLARESLVRLVTRGITASGRVEVRMESVVRLTETGVMY